MHEKAILTPMILQLFLSVLSPQDGFLALLLSQVGIYSLFPLFTGLQELPIKGLRPDFILLIVVRKLIKDADNHHHYYSIVFAVLFDIGTLDYTGRWRVRVQQFTEKVC